MSVTMAESGPTTTWRRSAGRVLAATIVGVVVAALLSTVAIDWLSPRSTSFAVQGGGGADRINLPPTAGQILVSFSPDNVDVSSRAERMADAYVVASCSSGCALRFELIDPDLPTEVSIRYIGGGSEYVNDIARSYAGDG